MTVRGAALVVSTAVALLFGSIVDAQSSSTSFSISIPQPAATANNNATTTEEDVLCEEWNATEWNATGTAISRNNNGSDPCAVGNHTEAPFPPTPLPTFEPTLPPTPVPTLEPTLEPTPPTPPPTPRTWTPMPTREPTPYPTEITYVPTRGPEPIRIFTLGDSITSNGFGYLSYRYYLWKSLQDLWGTDNFDFIGRLRDGRNGNPEWPDPNFDRDHEGHWGWTTDKILGQLTTWLGFLNAMVAPFSYLPDISLVHLGTNDCINEEPVDQILAELNQVVETLHSHNPSGRIFLAKLIPSSHLNIQEDCLDELNGRMDEYFASSPVSVAIVEMTQDFDVEEDLWDTLHPNNQGSEKMADRWLEAILSEWQGQS